MSGGEDSRVAWLAAGLAYFPACAITCSGSRPRPLLAVDEERDPTLRHLEVLLTAVVNGMLCTTLVPCS